MSSSASHAPRVAVSMERIEKSFGENRVLIDVNFDGQRGRNARAARRERRRQIDPDEGSHRGLHGGRRTYRPRWRGRYDAVAARAARSRHRDDLSGAERSAKPLGGGKSFCSAGAARLRVARRHATHDRRGAIAHRSLRLWLARLRACRRSRLCATPDGRDPEGALARREAPRHGRTDLVSDGARGRNVVRDGGPAQSLRHRHRLHQPSHGGRAAALRPHLDRQGRASDRAAHAERDVHRAHRVADVALARKSEQIGAR